MYKSHSPGHCALSDVWKSEERRGLCAPCGSSQLDSHETLSCGIPGIHMYMYSMFSVSKVLIQYTHYLPTSTTSVQVLLMSCTEYRVHTSYIIHVASSISIKYYLLLYL